ncbi:hypothetical protein, partial [Shewanella algae]|uniref:hypothetical protein n=1 Tax=Shewanella algae TaxID=38313 RepID=UPI00313BE5D1
FYIPALFGIPLAIGGWYLPNLLVRDQAEAARKEFSRSVAVYMELVGSERISGAPPAKPSSPPPRSDATGHSSESAKPSPKPATP